jgi:hypothetical protein
MTGVGSKWHGSTYTPCVQIKESDEGLKDGILDLCKLLKEFQVRLLI